MTPENLANLIKQLRADEGVRYTAYKDTLGNDTIGVGHLIESGEEWMLTATLNESQVNGILDADITYAIDDCEGDFSDWWEDLDEVRQAVLVNMYFNIAKNLFQFKNMLAAIEVGSYSDAAAEMLNSLWASQVKDRANRLAKQMSTGVWVLPDSGNPAYRC